MFKQIFVFSKWLVVLVLFVIFLHFFGIKSLERYLEKKVLVTKTNKLMGFIPAPAITICPFNPETRLVFPNNFSKEEEHKMRENTFGYLCGHLYGNASGIVDCIEELAYNLSSVVLKETRGMERDAWDQFGTELKPENWRVESFDAKGLCFVYLSPRHFGNNDMLEAITLHLKPYLEYRMFIHDPNFFVMSKNPGLNMNMLIVGQNMTKMVRLTVIEHHNLDVPSKRCNRDLGYNFTGKHILFCNCGCNVYYLLFSLCFSNFEYFEGCIKEKISEQVLSSIHAG